ncbi:unnamed protein product [Dovyalis caffra]|uniref:Uncharacterized protein n=1 Tax=Dovyalis caffra TaxID=77055 RepID=A0AAV1RNC5_9ROSI|nr:unnamed protein product [Dovyalis caffra]
MPHSALTYSVTHYSSSVAPTTFRFLAVYSITAQVQHLLGSSEILKMLDMCLDHQKRIKVLDYVQKREKEKDAKLRCGIVNYRQADLRDRNEHNEPK